MRVLDWNNRLRPYLFFIFPQHSLPISYDYYETTLTTSRTNRRIIWLMIRPTNSNFWLDAGHATSKASHHMPSGVYLFDVLTESDLDWTGFQSTPSTRCVVAT